MTNGFPIIKAGQIFNEFKHKGKIKGILKGKYITIEYPCRLDAMAINPAAVTYNPKMIFTPGEVVISIKKFIKVTIRVIDENGGKLTISDSTKRKVLVKHAYLIMCDALNISPSLYIDVDDNDIPKHCGFGSSSSTIAAVASAINELYGCQIDNESLIKYLASNHGEEISNDDNNLKVVQCIGGGATNGLTDEGIIIIAGKSTKIAKMYYDAEVIIGLPKDFIEKDAKELMELEEKNLWKFELTGKLYAEKIAYDLLHKALPDMANGSIAELAKVVFEYRFNMGSNENCSFTYDGLNELGKKLKTLFEKGDCEFLALSSVGPAYFAIVKNDIQKQKVINKMKKLNMNIIESSICNTKYIISDKDECNFWKCDETSKTFSDMQPSKYITDEINKINLNNVKCIDIGCGGGRYAKYLRSRNANVLAVDKYPEMARNIGNINFIKCNMDNIPVTDGTYKLALSIGVIHNSTSESEYRNSIQEISRILSEDGIAIFSTFTNDLITSDLENINCSLYSVKNREPMILLSKEKINEYINDAGMHIEKVIDEHITDVGSGKRNVYTIIIKK